MHKSVSMVLSIFETIFEEDSVSVYCPVVIDSTWVENQRFFKSENKATAIIIGTQMGQKYTFYDLHDIMFYLKCYHHSNSMNQQTIS